MSESPDWGSWSLNSQSILVELVFSLSDTPICTHVRTQSCFTASGLYFRSLEYVQLGNVLVTWSVLILFAPALPQFCSRLPRVIWRVPHQLQFKGEATAGHPTGHAQSQPDRNETFQYFGHPLWTWWVLRCRGTETYRPYSHKLLTINNYVKYPSNFAFACSICIKTM